jgi:DNA-nicking Smr family endonuclease
MRTHRSLEEPRTVQLYFKLQREGHMESGKDEQSAFRREMRDVTPLKPRDRVAPRSSKPTAKARHSRAARLAVLDDSLHGELIEQSSGDIQFCRPGVPGHALRQLRSGCFSVGAEIDLHGLTRLEAQQALKDFLSECAALGLGCVRVIHGKGSRSGPAGPVLKHAVHGWLTRWDDVLAFTSALTRHGGTGAVYVLLRRR